jgi:dihydroorotase
LLIISHCEDADLAQNFAVNEGKASWELMLPGRPAIAEEIMAARDAMLAADTGARIHIAHVSTARSVDIIRKAKEAGVKITAETCPQYFTITEDEIFRQGALARVNPPLRTKADVEAIICGLADGTLDVIATDHAPHTAEEKALPLIDAPSGMIGLETSLSLALTYLYHAGRLSLDEVIALMSTKPARILGCQGIGLLKQGTQADIVIFDPDEEWTVKPDKFKSKARNTPFSGMRLKGKVKYTISRGKIVYKDQKTEND